MNEPRFLKLTSRKPISLWDMIRYFASDLVDLLNGISAESDHAYIQAGEDQKGPTADATKEDRQRVLNLLKRIENHCYQVKLVEIKGRLNPFRQKLESGEKCPYPEIDSELKHLKSVIEGELSKSHFVFLPPSRTQFFKKRSLFGESVNAAFPSAAPEIKSAGNCMAFDFHTAAMFHLMRVAEIGLRALARHLKVPMKREQLEYANWGKIMKNISGILEELEPKANTKKKADAIEFYSGIAAELNGFKDVWRNNVMHVRKSYKEQEVSNAYLHVGDCMRRLAERISEK